MADTSDCLFCRILDGEVPSTEVLTTDEAYAFRDISPGAPVHVLVIPKKHIQNASTIEPEDEALVGRLMNVARQVAEQEGVRDSGYRLVFNVGDDALNSVPHLHLHVIGGRKMGWPPG